MAETRTSAAPCARRSASPEIRSLTLPSGRSATLRKGKGRDLMRAQRAVGGNPDPTAVVFALIAELAQIEGAPIVYEDVLELDLEDVLILQAEVTGTNFHEPAQGSPAPAPSQASSASDSESGN
ncbi:MAG TPA: phage tail assembly protein [Candidatus Binataceae bacterium]|nr:phage tail assembly protein [Candidatus Binataceae bacterium]